MTKKVMLSITLLINVIALSQAQKSKLTSNVNPFIGSKGHGHVFVGANVPFGAVQLGPTQIGRG